MAAGNEFVTLSWNEPEPDQENPVTDYVFEQSVDDGLSWTPAKDADSEGADEKARIEGLQAGGVYRFRVAAVTTVQLSGEVLQGDFAETDPIKVLGTPSQVSGIKALPRDDGALDVEWDVPLNGGDQELTYEVRVSDEDPAGNPAWETYQSSLSETAIILRSKEDLKLP